jgi:hypothetical protein
VRGRTTRESRNEGGMNARYRTPLSAPAVRARFRVSIPNPRRHKACPLPFRPRHSPGLRVFRFRTTRNQSTDPAHVLSCAYAPPQRLAPPLVAPSGRLGRPCLPDEAPRVGPQPFSISGSRNPSARTTSGRASERRCRAIRKSRLQGLATLLAASAPVPSGACFSPPRSWASLFRAFFRSRSRSQVSPGPAAPALSCQTPRPGTGAPAVFAHRTSGTPRSPTFFRKEWGPCPLELARLPGLPPPDMGRSFFLLPAPPALTAPASEEAGTRSPRGSLPAARHLPPFEGRRPAWRSRPTASATL